jgi:hypothetical protein
VKKNRAYNSVKFRSLVSLGTASGIFGFAGAKLSKVLCSFGDDIFEEFKYDAAEGFACVRQSVSGETQEFDTQRS